MTLSLDRPGMQAGAGTQDAEALSCDAPAPLFPLHIEDILARDGVYVSTTAGVSMWPMLRDRRDTIVVRPPAGRLSRFDVPLYRRRDAYVLHRVVEVLTDSYVILGDNCLEREVGIIDSQVVGVLTGFYRGDRPVDMGGWRYRLYVRIWCALYPVRRALMRLRSVLARGPVGDAVRAVRSRGGAR